MRDHDLLLLLSGFLELVFKPGPFGASVVGELSKVAYKSNGVKHDEAVAFVGKGAVVADVIIGSELLEGSDAANIVVARQEVDFGFEGRKCGLEGFNLVAESEKRQFERVFMCIRYPLVTNRSLVKSPTAIQKSNS